MIDPPKRLPEGFGPWGALYAWLNRLLEFVLSLAPVRSVTVRHTRTSLGTAYDAEGGEGGLEIQGGEPSVPRWG
jgi:hypothetical protein